MVNADMAGIFGLSSTAKNWKTAAQDAKLFRDAAGVDENSFLGACNGRGTAKNMADVHTKIHLSSICMTQCITMISGTGMRPTLSSLYQIVRNGIVSNNMNRNDRLATRNFPDDANNNNDSSAGKPSPQVRDPQIKADAKEKEKGAMVGELAPFLEKLATDKTANLTADLVTDNVACRNSLASCINNRLDEQVVMDLSEDKQEEAAVKWLMDKIQHDTS